VRISINEVVKTLLEAIGLVFFVMLLFLQNFRATFIPTIAVPVVLLGTFGVLQPLGIRSMCSPCSPWCWRSACWSTMPSWWSRMSSV
jgi:hypothetical protein